MTDDLLSAAQAGKLIDKSGETMRRWAAAQKIRHVRLPSGQIRFHRSDVLASIVVVERDTEGAA